MKRRRAVHEHTVHEDEDIFLHSLDEITPEQIGSDAPKHKRTGSELVSYIIERSVYFFAVAVFVICIVELAKTSWEQFVGKIYYTQVAEEFSLSHLLGEGSITPTASVLQSSGSAQPYEMGVSMPDSGIKIENTGHDAVVEELKATMASLSQQYPDMYAWIYIEDTKIDYPVVRGTDNDYYLNHAFTGEPLSIGSIFADYKLSDYILDNRNIVFYGHNSPTGDMFADVMKFVTNKDFFDTHNIYVYTSTGLYEFEPYNLTMFDYRVQYFRTYFSGDSDFLSFIDEMSANASLKKDMTFDENDKILTLSTCTKTGISTKRYCLQAKLVKVTE